MNADGILLAAGAVIRDEKNRILLVRHKPEREGYWKGKWICPGGKLEPGETLAEGALREVREETHLEVELERILPPFETVVEEKGEILLHVVYVDFLARVKGGALIPDDDIAEAEWWSAADIRARWEDLHADTQRLLILAGVVENPPP